MPSRKNLFIGLMSGTSLDGVDGVLVAFPASTDDGLIRMLASAYLPFPPVLREDLMALQLQGENEIHREAIAANALTRHYADCVATLLAKSGCAPEDVQAIGAHGQTIRHRPDLGYTRQTGNPALLAELTGIDVIADFRSRDIAAGGQGAPLVPAFHQAIFGRANENRVVANIGGISNISILDGKAKVTGFDTGPGNVLMDAWIARHRSASYDDAGTWAATGKTVPALLNALLAEPFLALPSPKSTGRDLFNMDWLTTKLVLFPDLAPVDVQATLAAFTAISLADAIQLHAPQANAVYVCGGGAYNRHLMHLLQEALAARHHPSVVQSTNKLGVSPNHVEALAFAWLARRHVLREAGNLAAVTGAAGPRILGGLYPA